MIKFVKCPYCGNQQKIVIDSTLTTFTPAESEFLQNECLKILKKIKKLQHKHDFEVKLGWKLNYIKNQISTLQKIHDILTEHL